MPRCIKCGADHNSAECMLGDDTAQLFDQLKRESPKAAYWSLSFYTTDVPALLNTVLIIFVDDTALISTLKDYAETVNSLLNLLDTFSTWCRQWKISIEKIREYYICASLVQSHIFNY